MHDDEALPVRGAEGGASRFTCSKSQADTDLLTRFGRSSAASPSSPPAPEKTPIRDLLERGEPAGSDLTPREEIVKLVARPTRRGKSPGCSTFPKTV